MDKLEQIKKKKLHYLFLLIGIFLSCLTALVSHNGFIWFSNIKWAQIDVLHWTAIALLLVISVVLQHFYLYLLRKTWLWYLIVIGISIVWIFNNGIMAMNRFQDWTMNVGVSVGWLSITDLISWLVGAVYFPVLIGIGAINAIIDANASMLSQACYYAKMAWEITGVSPGNIIDFGKSLISITWDMVSNSFLQDIMQQTSNVDSLFSFSFAELFSVPEWISNLGYSVSCICQ